MRDGLQDEECQGLPAIQCRLHGAEDAPGEARAGAAGGMPPDRLVAGDVDKELGDMQAQRDAGLEGDGDEEGGEVELEGRDAGAVDGDVAEGTVAGLRAGDGEENDRPGDVESEQGPEKAGDVADAGLGAAEGGLSGRGHGRAGRGALGVKGEHAAAWAVPEVPVVQQHAGRVERVGTPCGNQLGGVD